MPNPYLKAAEEILRGTDPRALHAAATLEYVKAQAALAQAFEQRTMNLLILDALKRAGGCTEFMMEAEARIFEQDPKF
ncbi:hypothetical protein HER39_10865 [Arthrobacter deserti]|uniref:Uncharacterized protein n=1 Tax=Arthrobacter deserti TaxID=1742687 RepID=A0ABX1JP61_9MICC|nr:hypothetical protein [Arthrobacter deserti]